MIQTYYRNTNNLGFVFSNNNSNLQLAINKGQGLSCSHCETTVPKVWSCMSVCNLVVLYSHFKTKDHFIGCGRRQAQHMLNHFEERGRDHCVCINLATGELWCYACDSGYDFRYDDDEDQKQKVMKVVRLLQHQVGWWITETYSNRLLQHTKMIMFKGRQLRAPGFVVFLIWEIPVTWMLHYKQLVIACQ